MGQFYLKNLTKLVVTLCMTLVGVSLNAQTTLAAGDLIFTGFDASVTPSASAADSYSFVLLAPVTTGTQISFSERGYFGSGTWQTAGPSESTVTWTVGSAIPTGTEVYIVGLNAYTYDTSISTLIPNGTVSLTEGTAINGLSLSTVGDQIIAFQGGGGSISAAGTTNIAGINYFYSANTTAADWNINTPTGPNSSLMPPGLTNGFSAFYTSAATGTTSPQSGKFNCLGTPALNASAVRTAVMNLANWGLSITQTALPSGCTFISSTPIISSQPSNSTICAAASTSFSISASGATSYQWKVSTNLGGSYSNISNGAPYSGATTATLTITGATAGMNSYMYQCVATSSGGSTTSNAATLTVNSAPAITGQPSPSTICAGGNTAFSATASNVTGYQWQVDQGAGFGSITNNSTYSGATTATLTITGATAGMNGYFYRVVATGTCTPNITSNSVLLTVQTITGTTTVTNVSCNGGANGTINLTPTGGTGGYTYSWADGPTTEDRTGLAAGSYSVTITDANNCTGVVNVSVTQPPVLNLAIGGGKTDVSCNGGANGTATVAPTGGTSGYTYSWNTTPAQTTATATGLTAGTYTVTVTDSKGCQATRSFNITQPAAITLSAGTVNNVSCNGGTNGSAQVIATGGTPSYTYSWAPTGGTAATASGLAAGTYTVTVTDANNCQATRNFTITQPTALTATTSQTNVLCNGGATGTATVTASGGTGAYSYLWSPSGGTAATATGLTVGNYSCLITDVNGCSITKNFTITQPTALVATTSQTNATCSTGGDASVTPSGGTPGYTYLWSPSGATTSAVTGLAAGNHSCLITDANGCTVTKNFTITSTNSLVASTFQTNILCNGTNTGSAGVIPSGAPGPYTYTWSPSGGNSDTATNLAAGTYSVLITASNGCSITKNFTITQPTALVASVAAQTNVSCNGGSNGSATVNVTGGTGSYTYSWAPSGGTAATASGLAAGTYTVTATDANLCQTTQTFTITQPAAITLSAGTVNNVSCNGGTNGSAQVIATGGTGTLTYSWAPTGGTAATATGLAPGTYTVTVTDANSCQATRNFTITQPTTITATTSQTNVLCNGGATGTATVTASGGTGSYTYLWSPSGGTAATATGLTVGNYSCLITDANGCSITKNFTINQPSLLGATTSQTNATCSAGGDASVTPFGGTPGYTYLWSPSGATTAAVTGLAAGNHSCLITDANGCTITKNFVITTNNTLVASTFQTNILCNGTNTGSAGVIPSGAPGPYTYTWSPSGGNADTATNLAAGTYSVLITASNGCSITKNFTITQPTALVANAGAQTNVSCNGGTNGSATVTATGGTGSYTYQWAPTGGTAATATGLAAGTYTVTVKDANLCQTTQTFTITQPAPLVASIGAQTNVSCNGGSNGSATVAVTGGTGTYTYQWSPVGGTAATASGLVAGTYTVTVKDANLCQTTQTFTITQPTALVASQLAQTNIACNGGSTGSATVAVTGGTGAYTYLWAPTGGTAATASGLSAGTYTVTVKDANLCQTTQSFTITQPTALVSTASSQTNVSCNGGSNGSATVSATGGTTPYTYSWVPASGTSATITGKPAGTYVATVTDANGCTSTQSFTITQPTALTATTTQNNVSCFGASNGSATVIVSGGTGSYTYSWNTTPVQTAATATGLSAGNYTVTVTDANSCSITRNFTITGTSALTITPTQTNVSCNGGTNGTATVAVTGGTGTYTYLWSPSGGTAATATGLAPGNYSVLVTDGNGCTGSQTFTITQPTLLVLNGSSSNISCNGTSNGVATVTPTGGTAPYTYSWAPSGGTAATATGLSGGNYTVTVTDANGCVKTRSYTIYEQAPIVVTSVKTDLVCHGATTGTATVTVTGGVPNYSYAWSTGAGTPTVTGLAAGTYTCTVTDALGCAVVHTVTITSPEAINVVVTQTNVSCSSNNDGAISLAVSGGVGPYTYQWTPASLGTTPTVSGLSAGNYSVTITDANGCTAVRNLSVTQPSAITFTLAIYNATCYGASDGTVDVASLTGGTPPYIFGLDSSNGGSLDPQYLAAGDYTFTIYDGNGCTSTQNFTITQPAQTIVTTQPQNVTTLAGTTITYTTAAQNASGYQWQYSTNGTNWNNVVNGGTNPTYAGATTSTLTITDVPHNYNGYLYRVALTAGANCITYTNTASLTVNNLLQAVNDDFSSNEILQSEGGIAGDVTANDLFNNQFVNDADITISVVDNDGLFGVAIDGDGNLVVPSNSNIGTYTVTYSICDNNDLTNCSSAEAIVIVTELSGIKDLTKLQLNLHPNPATTEVYVEVPEFSSHKNLKVTIYDLNGRLIKESALTSDSQSINVTGMESGVYIFNITSDTAKATRRVIVSKQF